MQDLEQAIRERAYQLWVESGFEDGNADANWLVAQREVLSASLGEFGRVVRVRGRRLRPCHDPSRDCPSARRAGPRHPSRAY